MDDMNINITIADKQYRLTVSRSDEEKVRKAVSLINDTIRLYGKNYSFKDTQDLLAMTALQYATLAVKHEADMSYNTQHLERKLVEIKTLLTEAD